jgi:single-stranded-DNA-specific exonuclease
MADKLEAFRDAFLGYLNEKVTDELLRPEVRLDAVVTLEEVDVRLAGEIERLSPFGSDNREPVLGVRDARVVRTEVVGKSHLRIMLKQNGTQRKAIGFGLADMHPVKGEGFDVAFHPCMDEWQGTKRLSLKVKDLQPSA